MDNKTACKTFIPQVDGRALDAIKICAAVFMVIDHINTTLLASTRLEMFLIGRITFPLFCYALAASMLKAGPDKAPRYALTRYAPRLLLFAVLTEPVVQFSRDIGMVGNVLFTLGLGAAIAGLSFRLKNWHMYILCALAIALMYFPAPIEFSAAGVMLPAAFLMALRGEKGGTVCLVALLCAVNLGDFGATLGAMNPPLASFMVMVMLATILPPLLIIRSAAQWPQQGRLLPKYFLHVFYPLHIFLIGLYGRFVMGMDF